MALTSGTKLVFDTDGLKLVGEPERLQQKVFYAAGIWRNLFSASSVTLGSNTFFSPAYDVTSDGKKFVVYSIGDSNLGQTPLSLVANWDVLLK